MAKDYMKHGASALLAAGAWVLVPTPSRAQEYCVVCQEPDAIYRCVLQNTGPSRRQPLKMACITALAEAGKHASCAVRGGTVFDCTGPIAHVDATSGLASGTAPATVPSAGGTTPKAPAAALQAAPKQAAPDDTPPATVEEAIKRTTSSTAATVSKAGQSISNGAKKSWNCVTSLFKSC